MAITKKKVVLYSHLSRFATDAKNYFVAKESGKGLSTNDYTTEEQTKLSGIATGAQVNVVETIKVNDSALTPDANKAVNIDLSSYALKTDIADIYKVKGNASVSTLNDLTKAASMHGDVYNMSEAGDLTNYDNSKTAVLAGDNVVLVWVSATDWKWDKLAATIDLSNYVQKDGNKVLSTNDYTTAEKTKLAGIAEGANNYSHPTGDGNLHVPATGTGNSGKVLTAGATAGSLSWEDAVIDLDDYIEAITDTEIDNLF